MAERRINPELLTDHERIVYNSRFETHKRQRTFQQVIEILTASICAARAAAVAALSDLNGACEDEEVNHSGLVGVAILRLQRAADPDAPAVVCACGPNPTTLCRECGEPICVECCWDNGDWLLCQGCAAGDEAGVGAMPPP